MTAFFSTRKEGIHSQLFTYGGIIASQSSTSSWRFEKIASTKSTSISYEIQKPFIYISFK